MSTTTTLQLWPRGKSVTYRGDVHGPSIEISEPDGSWRAATSDEHRQVLINELAKMYAERDIWCCDSSLVDGLLKDSYEAGRDSVASEFTIENVVNLQADPSNWTLEQCKEWLEDRGTAYRVQIHGK